MWPWQPGPCVLNYSATALSSRSDRRVLDAGNHHSASAQKASSVVELSL